jgi:hypothetical protein
MDITFDTWNVNLYRTFSLTSVSTELLKYKLHLLGVQEIGWEGGGTEAARKYTYFYVKGNENHEFGTGFLCIRESYQ